MKFLQNAGVAQWESRGLKILVSPVQSWFLANKKKFILFGPFDGNRCFLFFSLSCRTLFCLCLEELCLPSCKGRVKERKRGKLGNLWKNWNESIFEKNTKKFENFEEKKTLFQSS